MIVTDYFRCDKKTYSTRWFQIGHLTLFVCFRLEPDDFLGLPLEGRIDGNHYEAWYVSLKDSQGWGQVKRHQKLHGKKHQHRLSFQAIFDVVNGDSQKSEMSIAGQSTSLTYPPQTQELNSRPC